MSRSVTDQAVPGPAVAVDVSVIIVNWNTRELLRDCLRSIYEQTRTISVEIHVVDNASKDGSAEMVASEFPDVLLIRNSDNRGFAAANNQGISSARGRYVLLLNSDTRVLDQGFDKTVAFADLHQEAAVVGCRALNADGTPQWNCFLFPSLLNLALSLSRLSTLFPRSRFFGRARMTWWDYGTPRVVDAVAGCFMLVRREAINDVGLMPEDYFMYSEDTDWCWQFHRKGWKIMYAPIPAIVHLREGSSSQCATDMHILQRRSLLLFLEKKSGKTARRIANAMFVLASIARLFSLGMTRAVKAGTNGSRRRQWQLATAALRFHLLGHIV